MAEKKKILVVSDGSCVPTGFGKVAEAVLDRMHDTGEWEIHQLGINYFDTPHDKPYKIYMASAQDRNDWLGVSRVKELYERIEPDVVWLFQDFWHIANYIQHSPNMRGLVIYYPVDSPNIKSNWAVYMATATEIVTYTKFAADETAKSLSIVYDNLIRVAKEQEKDSIDKVKLSTRDGKGIFISANRIKQLGDSSNINIIGHGISKNEFYPIDKLEARKKLGFDPDWFIVGNVNRNQPRKRLDLTLKAFAKFAKDKPNARLLLHDPLPSKHEGWDIAQLANEKFGIGGKLIIDGGQGGNNLSVEELNNLYNTIDVMVNSGGGEGWGLCAAESACCKVAQIVPNWSATAEIWKNSGILINPISSAFQPLINTEHCVIDTDQLAEELESLYNDPDRLKHIGESCYNAMMSDSYDWDKITSQFIKIFNKAAEKRYIYDDTVLEIS